MVNSRILLTLSLLAFVVMTPVLALAQDASGIDGKTIADWFAAGKWLPAIGGILTLAVLGLRRLGLSKLVAPKTQGLVNTILTGVLVVAGSMVAEADLGMIITNAFTALVAPLFTHFVSSDKDEEAKEELAKLKNDAVKAASA
jgi:multisubunit Na+/H+ antiporter MnhG subunit